MKLKNRQKESLEMEDWLPSGESMEEGTKAFIGDRDVLSIDLGDSYMSMFVKTQTTIYT